MRTASLPGALNATRVFLWCGHVRLGCSSERHGERGEFHRDCFECNEILPQDRGSRMRGACVSQYISEKQSNPEFEPRRVLS